MFENGTLHIFEVDYPHSKKEYRCTAVNRLGVAKGDVRLTVVGGMPFFFVFNFALYMCEIGGRVIEVIPHIVKVIPLKLFSGRKPKPLADGVKVMIHERCVGCFSGGRTCLY